MTHDPNGVDTLVAYSGNERVMVGNGQSLPISHIGSVSPTYSSNSILLSNVLVVPGLKKNLISISQLTRDNNCCVTFSPSGFSIQDLVTRAVLGVGRCEDGLYVLDHHQKAFPSIVKSSLPHASAHLWHARLGHPHYRLVHSLSKSGFISCTRSTSGVDSHFCVGCNLGKSHRLPFTNNNNRCSLPFDRIHCDLWGPSPVTPSIGFRYYVVFVDDCT